MFDDVLFDFDVSHRWSSMKKNEQFDASRLSINWDVNRLPMAIELWIREAEDD